MKFSYKWLNEYFETKLPPAEELAEKVGLKAFELEEVEKLENGDILIDWDVLPNRSSDCFCYAGIVGEISAILNIPAKDILCLAEGVKFDRSFKTSAMVSLDIQDKKKVLRATKRMALDVKVGPSPDWLREKLESIGQKSINNVVDITNYVMWTTGQPVHAFDFDKLAGGKEKKKVLIKAAQEGETLVDLAGEKHKLDKTILVVADEEKSLDIAGVKGGDNSGVDESTTRVLMSVVNFEYENIRNTSKKLKLRTDASLRYENEIPLSKVEDAQRLFGHLLQELTGARVSEEVIDTKRKPTKKKTVKIKLEEVNSLLGLDLEKKTVSEIFKRLKFFFTEKKDEFQVEVPKERLDLNIKEDFIEEIGRIYGYENIGEKFPEEDFPVPPENVLRESIQKIGDILVFLGFFEVYNRTLLQNGKVELENSLNANATTLRANLLGGLKKKTEKNLMHSGDPKMFEIGKVFPELGRGKVEEHFSFAGYLGKKKIKEKEKEDMFYQTKGILEKIFESLSVKNIDWKEAKDAENFLTDIYVKKEKVGSAGFNSWEINLEELIKGIEKSALYRKVSKYPKIERDISFFIGDKLFEEAREILEGVTIQKCTDIDLLDIFLSEEGKRSVAFRLIFQCQDETLSDEFANQEMEKIYKVLKNEGFEVR